MWNFRITKEIRHHKYDHEPKIIYGIRDVLINNNGDIVYIGKVPHFTADSIDEIRSMIENMMEDCYKPVIDYTTGKTEPEVFESKRKRIEALQRLSDLDQELGLK
jgi:hypothetical protein